MGIDTAGVLPAAPKKNFRIYTTDIDEEPAGSRPVATTVPALSRQFILSR